MNLYVGNLAYAATEDDVRELFSEFGEVKNVTIIRDKFTQQPRGFCFVEMNNPSEGQEAMRELDGANFFERQIRVNEARPREQGGNDGGGMRRNSDSSGGNRRNTNYSQNRDRDRGPRRNNDW